MDSELLQAALVGLEHRRAEIDEKIAQVHEMLRNGASSKASPVTPTPKKHTMSAAGRKRIAAAQRKRWAAVKRAQTAQKRLSGRNVAKKALKAAVAKRVTRRTITAKPKKAAPKGRPTPKAATKRSAPKKVAVKKTVQRTIAVAVPAEVTTA